MHHYDNENRVCTGFFGFEHLWSYFFRLSIQIVWFSGLVYVAALGESLFWKREFSKQLGQLSISINWFPNIILGGYLLLS